MTQRQVDRWLITAPQETFEAILEVTAERSRQEEKGWTPEHDDEHGVQHLLVEAYNRLSVVGYDAGTKAGASSHSLVVVAALLVAAIEANERRPGSTEP
ncbi:hypothetical protein [uncultured Microbacterium sp.]|uniref:hypothetical protein n=1 Tax=uncultured Microbacterium sp. TaxID=191216 RepID=UPI0025CFEF54|nr:hypothetical protein [uncultured Microbacterium sp.]